MQLRSNIFRILFIALIIFSSCKTEKESLVEPVKNFTGTWKISKVVRDQVDITPWIDTTNFTLVLNSDNTYTLSNSNIPFVANSSGNWSVDDPAYPYHISFLVAGTDTATANFLTPVDKGKRSMVISFSPGCISNTYVYTLQNVQ